jgi:16S rRNA (guanine527-N7)-methyltransferase
MESHFIRTQLEKALHYPVSEGQAAILVAHLNYVLEQNESLNLTRINEPKQGVLLHIEDSLSALFELDEAPEGCLVDLGSGGGFPGIPLLVMRSRKGVLIEAKEKKARVLRAFLRTNGLEDKISVEARRVEEVARERRECFAVATARALSSLPALMELAAPLLMLNGVLLAYKGDLAEAELDAARSLEDMLGMTVIGIRTFLLSDGASKRTIVRITKTSEAKRELPRRNGQAQRHPLKAPSS